MVSVTSFTNSYDIPKKVINERRNITHIPRPAVLMGRPRTEKFCCLTKSSETSTNLFICATSATYIDTGTCTDNNVTESSTDMLMSGDKNDPVRVSSGMLNNDNEYTKWMKQLQFPDTLQALFLSEKGLRKFQKIIQDQLKILEKKNGGAKACTKHLPPISYYQIAETKSKSESDFVKVKRCGAVPETNILHQSLPPFARPKRTPDTNVEGSLMIRTENAKYSSKGLLHIDEIKKDLISICAYIFKQTRIINELWKYLEKNSGSKHQLNKENVKNITAGALNQHLNKLHSIRENLFKFNEKYRADLDKRIHLLKQISNYYKDDQEFPRAVN